MDDEQKKVYTLTAAQADEGEGTKNLKLRNVKGQGGVRDFSSMPCALTVNLVSSYSQLVFSTKEFYSLPPERSIPLSLIFAHGFLA